MPETLSSGELASLAAETSLSAGEITALYAQFIGQNPTGQLSIAEFTIVYQLVRPEAPQQLDQISAFLFPVFDEDNSGTVSFSEFVKTYDVTTNGEMEDKLGVAFEVYDLDNTELVDLEELKTVLPAMVDLLGANDDVTIEEMAQDAMKKLDLSYEYQISREEFVKGLMKNYGLRQLLNPFC